MRHVLVETNWVVGYAAPAHHQQPAARQLLDRARGGDVRLHLPVPCLTEARFTIERRCQPRNEADAIRDFVLWARSANRLDAPDGDAVLRVLDMFEARVKGEIRALKTTLEALRHEPGVEVYALDDAMLERAMALGASELYLSPYDQAILSAVLVRAERLRDAGETDVVFCELDADLLPLDKRRAPRQPLATLYQQAGLRVIDGFDIDAV